MKKIILAFLILMIIILAGCSSLQPEKIGIMDMDRLLQVSKRAQKLQQELLDTGNKLEAEYAQKEKELEGKDSEEELDKIYQKYLDSKERLEKVLNQEIEQALAEISRENKLEIVISKDEIFYGGMDVTEEVIKRLDEELTESGEEDGVEK